MIDQDDEVMIRIVIAIAIVVWLLSANTFVARVFFRDFDLFVLVCTR